MKFGIVQFPGSNCDQDAYHALADVLGQPTRYIWHKDTALGDVDCVVVPGGFSYGDYLRTGAIARFSPAMKAVIDAREIGRAGHRHLQRIPDSVRSAPVARRADSQSRIEIHLRPRPCARRDDQLAVHERLPKGQVLRIPIAHGEGSYFAEPQVIEQLQREDRILLRYCTKDGKITDAANPNGSLDNIAGICNEARNVFGLMPHPERASENCSAAKTDDGYCRKAFCGRPVRASS